MFDAIAKGFRQAKNRLAGLTELTEQNIDSALREVRLSLLEADVELGVVKTFLARVKEKAIGETVQTRVKAGGQVHQVSAADATTGVMMVGLQGSGKTTTAAKLARWLSRKEKRPLLVAADMQRPAAV